MTQIVDTTIGQRVRSAIDLAQGEVIEVGYAAIKIRWDDGIYSTVQKREGWGDVVPIEGRCEADSWHGLSNGD